MITQVTDRLMQELGKNMGIEGYDFNSTIPANFWLKFCLKHSLDYDSLIQTVRRVRNGLGIRSYVGDYDLTKEEQFHRYLRDCGYDRTMPSKETHLCQELIEVLGQLPSGGYGLLTGTPTCYSVSTFGSWTKKIIDDNLRVAQIFRDTVDIMELVVGDSVNFLKAQHKVKMWKCFLPSVEISSAHMIKDDFCDKISTLVRGKEFVKVVLMGSGVWKGFRGKKYNPDFHFELASSRLIRKYANLIILAMARKKHTSSFEVVACLGRNYRDLKLRLHGCDHDVVTVYG